MGAHFCSHAFAYCQSYVGAHFCPHAFAYCKSYVASHCHTHSAANHFSDSTANASTNWKPNS
jgi:hypothetical protein